MKPRPNVRDKAAAVLLLAALVIGLVWLFQWRTDSGRPKSTRPAEPANLGITFVPVSTNTASYYGLGIGYGALITEVVPGSLADHVGLQPGSVIVSFNGAPIQDGASLTRLILDCMADHGSTVHEIHIDAWIGGCIHSFRMVHGAKPLY